MITLHTHTHTMMMHDVVERKETIKQGRLFSSLHGGEEEGTLRSSKQKM